MAYFRVCGRRRRRVRDEAHFPKLLVCLWRERLIGCVTVPNSLAPAELCGRAKLAQCVDAENGQAGKLTLNRWRMD